MTRKHYQAIAAILSTRRSDIHQLTPPGEQRMRLLDSHDETVAALGAYFEKDNERFDTERFYVACYRRKEE